MVNPLAPETALARYRSTGDPEAFGAFFDATAAELHRAALAMLPDAVAAEDAVQATYVSALRLLDRFEAGRPVMPWLVAILEGHVLHARRAHARRRVVAEVPATTPAPLADDATPHEDVERTRAAIDALEEPYRSAALLRWRYGLEPAEIAHVRGEPPGTTRSILSRALERLRRALRVVPALLVGFAAAPRGLGAIRSAVVRDATVVGTSGAAVAVVGGIMGKKAVLVAAALLLLAAGGTVFGPALLRSSVHGPDAPSAPSGSTSPSRAAALAANAPARDEDEPIEADRIVALGQVVDEGSVPIEGARVFSVPVDLVGHFDLEALREGDEPRIGRAASGADGRFRVPLAGRGRLFDVRVSAPGRDPALLVDVLPGDLGRIVLAPEGRVVGRVIDESGAAIRDVPVRLRSFAGASHSETATTTGADGRYALSAPRRRFQKGRSSGSSFSIEVRGDGFAPVIVPDYLLAPQDANGVVTFNVMLRRGSSLVGRVVDGETGAGFPRAVVRVVSTLGLTAQFRGQARVSMPPTDAVTVGEATSGADGGFRIDHLPCVGSPGSHMGTALGTAVAVHDGWIGIPALVPLVAEGAAHEVVLRMYGSASVSGRVRHADGEPPRRASVAVLLVAGEEELSGTASQSSRQIPVSPEGTYHAAAVPAFRGSASLVRIFEEPVGPFASRRSSHTPTAEVRVRAGEAVSAPDLVLERARELRLLARLRVVDPAGRPVAGADVLGQPILYGWTDSDGRFRLERVPEARSVDPWLCVRTAGFAPSLVDVSPFPTTEPAGGREVEERTVVLRPGGVLTGRVSKSDGAPAVDAIVGVALPGAKAVLASPVGGFTPVDGEPVHGPVVAWATAAADGSFRVEDLPPGPFLLFARLARGGRDLFPEPSALRVERRDVAAGADVDLRLPADDLRGGGPLVVRVTDAATGRPVDRAAARATRDGAEAGARTLGGGEFSVAWLPEGTWDLIVSAPGFVDTVVEGLEIAADREPPPVTAALRRGARIAGRVVGPAGVSFASHEMRLSPVESDRWSQQAVVVPLAADGSFLVTGLRAGRHRAHVAPAGDLSVGMKPFFASLRGTYLVVEERESTVAVEVPVEGAGILEIGVVDEARLPYPPMRGFPVATPEQLRFGASLRVTVTDEAGALVADQRGIRNGGYVGAVGGLRLPAGRYRARLWQDDRQVDEATVEVRAEGAPTARQRVVLRPPPP